MYNLYEHAYIDDLLKRPLCWISFLYGLCICLRYDCIWKLTLNVL